VAAGRPAESMRPRMLRLRPCRRPWDSPR